MFDDWESEEDSVYDDEVELYDDPFNVNFDELKPTKLSWRVRWESYKLSARVKVVTWLMRITHRVCPHFWCSLHENSEGKVIEICAICGQEV